MRLVLCLFTFVSMIALVFLPPLHAAERGAGKKDVVVTDYGAEPHGSAVQSATFQAAIRAVNEAGGGTVHVPPGTYLLGTIDLLSGVTLDLDKGATLLGSPSVADYRRGNWPALIKAKGQHHIGVVGSGVIDGQGKLLANDTIRIFDSGRFTDFFPDLKPGEKVHVGNDSNPESWIDPYAMQAAGTLGKRVAPRSREDSATWRVDEFVRPQLLEFWQCQEVRVSGINLKNAANWVQTYRDCDDVVIEKLKVESTTYWNNDGLDLVNSRHVTIRNCDLNVADDGICLKTEPSAEQRGCTDITVQNCRIRSSASAFKLGTSSYHDFRRIEVRNLEIYDTYRSAIALESVDGGTIDDVTISNVRARHTGNALFIRLGNRNRPHAPGAIRNLTLSDISVEIPFGRPDEGYEHAGPPITAKTNLIPSSITGLSDAKVENITLRKIEIAFGGKATRTQAEVSLRELASVPEKRESYPEFSMFGELPAWGLFLRHAKNVALENITFRLISPDYRSALIADEVENLHLKRITFRSAGEEPVLVLSSVSGEQLEQINYPTAARERLRRIEKSIP